MIISLISILVVIASIVISLIMVLKIRKSNEYDRLWYSRWLEERGFSMENEHEEK